MLLKNRVAFFSWNPFQWIFELCCSKPSFIVLSLSSYCNLQPERLRWLWAHLVGSCIFLNARSHDEFTAVGISKVFCLYFKLCRLILPYAQYQVTKCEPRLPKREIIVLMTARVDSQYSSSPKSPTWKSAFQMPLHPGGRNFLTRKDIDSRLFEWHLWLLRSSMSSSLEQWPSIFEKASQGSPTSGETLSIPLFEESLDDHACAV